MKLIYPGLIIILIVSCSHKKKPAQQASVEVTTVAQAPAIKDEFAKGEIIPSINIGKDSLQKFALYLPSSYSISQKFPVIIFFDPHAEGLVPIKLYKELAEKNNIILVASNSSKNGLEMTQTSVIANNLIDEVISRISVDQSNISLCGFSGGAKVALSSGGENPAVSTIIYCGAAMNFQPSHQVNLIGFAGKKDMNYCDVVSFEKSMKDFQFKHFLIEWNGKHEFPSSEVFNDAVQFIKTGRIDNYEKKQVTISDKKLIDEQKEKQKYINAFRNENMIWWVNEINSLNKKKKTDLMYERMLGFISLACYSMTNNAIEHNDLQAAEYTLTIYKLADPQNEAVKQFTEELKRRKNKLSIREERHNTIQNK